MGLLKTVSDALAPLYRPAPNQIEGVVPGSWASPQNPIRPTLQLGTGIRQWDFTPGLNLQFTPRGDQPISFQQLWNVSNSFDLCRLMIEKRKNEICNRPWAVRVKPVPGETKKQRLTREGSNENVKRLTQLLLYPDGQNRWPIWIRQWAEQMLVYDAPTIFPMRAMDGSPLALRVIAGQTITPLVDQHGFRPQAPSPAFQQIILGIPSANLAGQKPVTFSAPNKAWKPGDPSELFYHPKNPRVDSRWGFSPVEQIIVTLSIAANRQQFLRDYYTSGNVPEGLLPMPEDWSVQQIRDFQKWFDSILAGNLRMKRRMIAIPGGKPPVMTKEAMLTDQTDDYLNRIVAFAFGESPQALVKQVGHQSTAKEGNDQAQSVGLEPDLKHIEGSINDIFLRFGYDDVEFAFQDEEEIDPVKAAQVSDIRLKNGSVTINEDREARGEDPRPEPEADMLGTVTATGWMPLEANAAAERNNRLNPQPDPAPPKGQAQKVRKGQMKIVAGDLTPGSRHALNGAKRALTTFLADQKVRVAKTARAAFEHEKVRKGDLETDTDRALIILAAIKWDYPTLYAQLQPYLEKAALEGASSGAYQVTAQAGANLQETQTAAEAIAKAAAEQRAAELVGLEMVDGKLVEDSTAKWAMSTTLKDDVLKTIRQAVAEDWTPSQLEAVISASVLFTQDHAEVIAENEVSRQQALGSLAAWRVSRKVLEYAWTVMDLGCCPLCESFSMLGSVPVGYQFAPMITAPGAHPGCRCWLTATKFAEDEA
jgi:hypothetical protein